MRVSPHPANLRLWNPPEAGVEVQVFSARQQLIDGVKLWAVAHVLMDIQDLSQNAARITQWKHEKNWSYLQIADQ